jgi:tryptophan synthase alpha chain
VRQQTDLPLVVGFGISSAAQVAQVGRLADGAIVGSALLNHIEQAAGTYPDDMAAVVASAAAFVRDLRGGSGS